MLDADATAFDPEGWSMKWAPPLHTGARSALMTSPRGSVLRASENFMYSVFEMPRPIWNIVNRTADRSVGWISRSPRKDVLLDLHDALTFGATTPIQSGPFEMWLMEQGLLSGTWRYHQAPHHFTDGQRRVPLWGVLQTEVSEMFGLSRFIKFGDTWRIVSGAALMEISLPSTRHGVMHRRAEIMDTQSIFSESTPTRHISTP